MNYVIYFSLFIISFFSCKQTEYEHSSEYKILVQNIGQEQNVHKETAQKVCTTIIPSPKNNGLVDSILFFGATFNGKEVVDSFYIFFRNREYQCIIIEKDEDGFSNYHFTMPYDKDQIFRNFNPDKFVDLVFFPIHKAPSQLSWSVVYLYNPASNSFELADHLALEGLEYNENLKEYIQKMNCGIGCYEFKRYRITQNQDWLDNYEYLYIEHDFKDEKYDRIFYIEYENYDTNLKYKDTCRINIKDCQVKYLSCNYSIYQKLKQTWIDFYAVGNQLGSCPELDL